MMKHAIRDTIISILDVIGAATVYRSLKQRRGPLVRVLCFHDVSDREWFERVIKMVAEDYNVVTPEQFRTRQFQADKINILVTFDDGYQSWVDTCLPVLKKYDVRGLFFVNSGLLEVSGDDEKVKGFMENNLLISPKKPLTWTGLRLLVLAGHSVGGHTVHHIDLGSCTEEEGRREIEDDKKNIESKLDTLLVDFAYPFGRRKNYSDEMAHVAFQAGYERTYGAESNFVGEGRAHIPRTLLEKHQSLPSVRRWIGGGFDVFSAVKRLIS